MEKRITILGAGESGTGAAILAKHKGYDVLVSDNGTIAEMRKDLLNAKGIRFEENGHSEAIYNSDLVIKSPGIRPDIPAVLRFIELGIEVIDEIEFAARFTSSKLIAITGTNGKTTTTLLTYHLLKNAGFNVGLTGNVGHSMARMVAEDPKDIYVIEMSSYQIDGTVSFKPDVAVLLNITPDHMDRYDYNLDNYVQAKFNLIRNMSKDDLFITYSDNDLIKERLAATEVAPQIQTISLTHNDTTAFFANDLLVARSGFRLPQKETSLYGPHNAINTLAAVLVAQKFEISEDVIKEGLKTFKNAPHRLEYVDTINEVDFVNDSKATNVDAVKYALDSFSSPLVWIAGGVDKGNDYSLIMEAVNQKVRTLICLGKDNTKLREAFHNEIISLLETDSMKQAVDSALEYAQAHDVVLLSPACASFDLFKNYEDRGNQFKEAVLELKEEYNKNALRQ